MCEMTVIFNMKTYSHRSLVLMLLIIVVGATYGVAVEPPRRVRNSRSHHVIKMNVNPSRLTMRYGDTVKVKCRARGGIKVEDMPFISFYRKLGPYTVLPMSSGFPGVTIETIAPGRISPRHNRSVKYMSLGPEVWDYLYPGENIFYCKGYNMKGQGESAYFTINKL